MAFATQDAIAVARRMLAQGVPLLAIPDNYYDDLAARTELGEDDDRAAARAQRPLRGSPDGEFLHFFTETVGDRLFFEVVERRGAYDGYGVLNSPVRLSAQLHQVVGARPV